MCGLAQSERVDVLAVDVAAQGIVAFFAAAAQGERQRDEVRLFASSRRSGQWTTLCLLQYRVRGLPSTTRSGSTHPCRWR